MPGLAAMSCRGGLPGGALIQLIEQENSAEVQSDGPTPCRPHQLGDIDESVTERIPVARSDYLEPIADVANHRECVGVGSELSACALEAERDVVSSLYFNTETKYHSRSAAR